MQIDTYKLLPKEQRETGNIIDEFIVELRRTKAKAILQGNEIQISYDSYPYKATFIFPSSDNSREQNKHSSEEIVLVCQDVDPITPYFIKLISSKLGYRMYSDTLQCFLPLGNIVPYKELAIYEKATKVMRAKGYKPLFYINETEIYYAQNLQDNTIHIINPYMFHYFQTFGVDENNDPEFSYEVASSINEFVAFADELLIPVNFYKYYQKPLKVLNDSGFDITNIDRKVFIKPLIWELNDKKNQFYLLSKEGSSLIYMDKVLKDETLEGSLKRILKDDLGIADDFIRARVLTEIEFDRDRDDNLTPRLVVDVFVDKIENSQEIDKKSRRTWN